MNEQLSDYIPYLLGGVPVTLEVMTLAMLLVIPTALILALGRMSRSRLVRWASGLVVELFRGTSALVQLFWAFYVLPYFGLELTPLQAGVIVLGLNEGSYFSEVVRPALQSVLADQRDAAISLHLPRSYQFFRIILPQALPVMIPPFGNALIGMLKFTALVSLVTLQDITFRAGAIRTALGDSTQIYSLTLLIYFGIALLLGGGVKLLERWVNRRAGRVVPPLKLTASRRTTQVPPGHFSGGEGGVMSSFPWDWGFAWSILPALLEGLRLTVVATLAGSALAFVLGLVWIALRLANLPIISPAANLAVQFLRGTPFLVQLYFVFYVLPNYGLTFSAIFSGILGLAIYNSAPVSEIYRAGIEGVAPGQWEVCLTLGVPVRWVWSGVVLPQAFQTVTPMLGNIVIAMFKDTAVLSTITVAEMMSRATDLSMQHFRYVEPMTMVAALYFVVSCTSAKGVQALERWNHRA